ncbi:MAG TPA: bifunctional nuclease family protein [Planctomycetota bacterium]|nr:bifunctional nuclease family protein [Planctomycetota bacterium]
MGEQLHKIRIKKVLGPTNTGTAVLLGNDQKTFVMFIGIYEGAAIIRELNGESPARPLTHELMSYVMAGFSIEVKQIVISDIVDNTFCATLVLEQKCVNGGGDWNGKRNEVRIDARPSDCLVIALKEKKDIYATQAVLDKVRDISEEIGSSFGPKGKPKAEENPYALKEFDVSSLKEQFENFEFDLGGDKDDEDEDEE